MVVLAGDGGDDRWREAYDWNEYSDETEDTTNIEKKIRDFLERLHKLGEGEWLLSGCEARGDGDVANDQKTKYHEPARPHSPCKSDLGNEVGDHDLQIGQLIPSLGLGAVGHTGKMTPPIDDPAAIPPNASARHFQNQDKVAVMAAKKSILQPIGEQMP